MPVRKVILYNNNKLVCPSYCKFGVFASSVLRINTDFILSHNFTLPPNVITLTLERKGKAYFQRLQENAKGQMIFTWMM
jgi:hypothetical protein